MATGDDTLDDYSLVLLLPERRRLAAAALAPDLARNFGQADRLADCAPGEMAQLRRFFELPPAEWPMAALTRDLEFGDAGTDTWLRADPAFVRAEMSGARLMAYGDLGLVEGEADELLAPLRPLFGDAGMPISAGADGRWYLRIARAAPIPTFAPPSEALGADVLPFLPVGRDFAKWRALFNEAQVLLHNHPRNAARIASGLPPVNSLWFWGGGAMPSRISAPFTAVLGGDFELRALARRCGASDEQTPSGPELRDHRRDRDWSAIAPALRFARDGRSDGSTYVDFADGTRYRLRRGQGWRLWRRSLNPCA